MALRTYTIQAEHNQLNPWENLPSLPYLQNDYKSTHNPLAWYVSHGAGPFLVQFEIHSRTRTLLVAKCIAPRNMKLLVAVLVAPGITTRNKKLLGWRPSLLGPRVEAIASKVPWLSFRSRKSSIAPAVSEKNAPWPFNRNVACNARHEMQVDTMFCGVVQGTLQSSEQGREQQQSTPSYPSPAPGFA